jgi:hypothetical protein
LETQQLKQEMKSSDWEPFPFHFAIDAVEECLVKLRILTAEVAQSNSHEAAE